MFMKFSIALLAASIPALADVGLFEQIGNKSSVTLVLPAGECSAKVVGRKLDELTLVLDSKTNPCGPPKALVTLIRSDVRDVVRKHRPLRDPLPGICAWAGIAFVGAPAALAIAEKTGNAVAATVVLFGSGVGGALLCRDRGRRYTILAERVGPVQ